VLLLPGGAPLAITAYHVAGPGSGSYASRARLCSPLSARVAVRLSERLDIPGARTIGPAGSQHDVAAFRIQGDAAALALELADSMPAVGDTVWVLAVHAGAAGPGRHPARVAVAHDSAFVYAYLGSANTNATSGAAVLDRAGKVVGLNAGTLIMNPDAWRRYRERYPGCCDGVSGGEVVGLAVNLGSLRRHLERLR
jgi:hypothetical protein